MGFSLSLATENRESLFDRVDCKMYFTLWTMEMDGPGQYVEVVIAARRLFYEFLIGKIDRSACTQTPHAQWHHMYRRICTVTWIRDIRFRWINFRWNAKPTNCSFSQYHLSVCDALYLHCSSLPITFIPSEDAPTLDQYKRLNFVYNENGISDARFVCIDSMIEIDSVIGRMFERTMWEATVSAFTLPTNTHIHTRAHTWRKCPI